MGGYLTISYALIRGRSIWQPAPISTNQHAPPRTRRPKPCAAHCRGRSDALIQRALGILARWDKTMGVRSKPLRDEWARILVERDWELALSTSERGNQLRQASPVSCVLPTERRLEIIRATSIHRDHLHLLSSENIAKATAIAMALKSP